MPFDRWQQGQVRQISFTSADRGPNPMSEDECRAEVSDFTGVDASVLRPIRYWGSDAARNVIRKEVPVLVKGRPCREHPLTIVDMRANGGIVGQKAPTTLILRL